MLTLDQQGLEAPATPQTPRSRQQRNTDDFAVVLGEATQGLLDVEELLAGTESFMNIESIIPLDTDNLLGSMYSPIRFPTPSPAMNRYMQPSYGHNSSGNSSQYLNVPGNHGHMNMHYSSPARDNGKMVIPLSPNYKENHYRRSMRLISPTSSFACSPFREFSSGFSFLSPNGRQRSNHYDETQMWGKSTNTKRLLLPMVDGADGVMLGITSPNTFQKAEQDHHRLQQQYFAKEMKRSGSSGSVGGLPSSTCSAIKKDKKDKKDKRSSTAPKRGEYRCGKCGFFPKKNKHSCEEEKEKRSTIQPQAPHSHNRDPNDNAMSTVTPGQAGAASMDVSTDHSVDMDTTSGSQPDMEQHAVYGILNSAYW